MSQRDCPRDSFFFKKQLTNPEKNGRIIESVEKPVFIRNAGVAELADAQASGACGSNIVWVQIPSPAFFYCNSGSLAK